MDGVSIISLAGNAVQFVDFLAKITSKTVEICQSADGSLADTTELARTSEHLGYLSKTLETRS